MKVLAITNIYPTESNPDSGTFVEQQITGLRNIGIDVSVLFVDRRKQGMGVYLRLPALIRSTLAHFEADLVHVMYGGVMADLATCVVQDRPTVVTFHGSDLLGEHLSGSMREWIAAYGIMSSKRAARRARGIVVVAKALQEKLPLGVEGARVRVIPCGIDLARFIPLEQLACRQKIKWREDHFHVLFNSGGDDPVKRPGLARSAVASLNRMGVRAEMHELRGVPNGEVPLWLNASDVLLLTSLHEGSPTIVKEALACDVPVVSVDVGDVRERIDKIAGCYLASADPEDLAAKLRLIYNDRRKVEARSEIKELSVERIAWRLAEFYEELVRSKNGATCR